MIIAAYSRVLEKLRVALLDKKSPTSHKPENWLSSSQEQNSIPYRQQIYLSSHPNIQFQY